MSDDLQVVFFQDRHGVGLGALRGGGPKNSVLIDEEGEVHRLRHSRTLHVLGARIRGDDPPRVRDRLRALRRELTGEGEALDAELFDAALTDQRRYTLGELATIYFGDASDRAVARLVAALDGGDGWIAAGLRIEQGEILRLDAETRRRIREQRAREATKRRQEEALLAWWEPRRGAPGGLAEPPADPDARERLEALRAYALAGDHAPDAAWSRHLAKRLGHDGPDALLAELERGGALPRHVNEVPHRLALPLEFGEPARATAAALAALPPPRGEDLRARYAVAIDDAGTREVDDAFAAWPDGDDVCVAVHIARLDDLVPPEGALEREALRRATSVYFADGTVPMLPEELGERASLSAGHDRGAVTLLARVAPDGEVRDVRFTASVVNVGQCLGYEDAPQGPAAAVLEHALRAAAALRAARLRRGAVQLSLPQLKLSLEDGVPSIKAGRTETVSHLAVSELMILFNAALGQTLRDARVPALFRTQPKAVRLPAREVTDPLYAPLSRRGLPPTIVSIEPGPHRMLGAEAYVQGTSPIRRASDLLAQRQLLAVMAGAPAPYDRPAMERLKAALELVEKRAQRAMDERERYWLVEWFARRAEPLQGVVSRLDGPRGLMVYLPEVDREVPLRMPSPPPPRLGDRLLVRVARAAPRERSVLLEAV